MARRGLIAIGCLAFALHAMGMARSLLPAQDGLKFIRFARRFQTEPWADVVRGSDQHPLYSALVALVEPPVALLAGDGPTAWRVAAQLVSVVAALATLIPLFGFARALFGEQAGVLATLVYVVLPIPGAISRDTLSDSLALFFFVSAMRLGEVALRTGRRSAWIGTGLVAGFGYLARPEILLVPVAVALTQLLPRITRLRESVDLTTSLRPSLARISALGIASLAIVGCYALVKGDVSEKLALRTGLSLRPSAPPVVKRQTLPPGLDDPRWDFSPKEESTEIHIKGSTRATALRLVQQWAEGLGWVMLPFFVWGVVRARTIVGSTVGRRLVGVYLVVFAAIVIRHATALGYLSGRHALTMVAATVPWVGAGLWAWLRGLPERRGLSAVATHRLAAIGLTMLVGLGVAAQVKAMHPSRWGHWAAGQWLIDHARPDESVLDTRGWATFVRGGPAFDPWHIRQALADDRLAYIVVGTDELTARSRRATTLKALLAYAGSPVAEFPERQGEPGVGIRVYRFQRPDSWEGMRP